MFISYRREDASGFAGRLHDDLTEHFGPARVFRDVETIEPGADFADVIGKSLESCRAFVAVIGREWVVSSDGRRRLDDPTDWVRVEVAAAIERDGVTVLPVLVEGVSMPEADELPEPLRPLTRYNALEVSDSRWDYDVQRLVDRLEAAVGRGQARRRARLRRVLVPRSAGGAAARLL
ncbi:MAG: toll/interleukin-1 receptor domain-containing protein, partial [Actinomycetota bacterium]|nr:toll/interleukin-1 receptor domain-containing protein [Actinomycetota bacterium]